MNTAMAQRLTIASRLAAAFEPMGEIRACCVMGSVALGTADGDSDLDLAFVCAPCVPTPGDRLRLYVALGEGAEADVLGIGTFDYLEVDGVRVEPEFHARAELEQRMADAAVGMGTERQPPSGILSAVHYSKVLFDKGGVVARLKARAELTDPLRRTIMRQGGFLDDPHLIYEHERACARCDVVYALRCQSAIVDHFVQMLFALNGTHCPGDKYVLPMIRTMGKPGGDFCGRLERFLALPNDAEGLIEKSRLARWLFETLRDSVREELGPD